MLHLLAALAREDARASNPPTAQRLLEGVFLALAFEAEARSWGTEHGVKITGSGLSSRPIGTNET